MGAETARGRRRPFGIALIGAWLLAACHLVGPDATKGVIGYNPLYDQADELRDLVDKGDLTAAKTLYAKNQAFFRDNQAKHAAVLSSFAAKINEFYDAKWAALGAALAYRDDEASWPQQKEAVAAASSALADYNSFMLVREAAYRSAAADALDAELHAVRDAYRTNAVAALVKYGNLARENFFFAYPSTIADADVLSAALPQLAPRLETMSSDDILSFARLYRPELRTDTEATISRVALTKGLREQGRSFDPAKRLRLLDGMRAAGLNSTASSSALFGVILLDGAPAAAAFPVTVDRDLPVPVAKLSAEDFARNPLGSFDQAVVIRVNKTAATRKIVGQSRQSSTFIAGYRSERNPAYEAAEFEVVQAQDELRNARLKSTLANGISGGVDELLAQRKLDAAMNKLRATAPTIEKAVTEPYDYRVAAVMATRTADLDLFVIERGGDKARKFTRSFEDSRKFTIVYGLRDKDTKRDDVRATTQTEDNLSSWEGAPLKMSGHELLAKLADVPSVEVALAGLRQAPATAQVLRHERGAADSGSTTRGHDRRFSSVVIVRNPGGGFGSGFFVRSDVIMTNRHVVEGAGLAKIVTVDGQEATGKVIATDIDRDLALLRVPLQGPPVAFPKGGDIEPGTSVDAIGHPKGLTFSITRGIVSGLRMISLTVGRKVAYVQTDTALSPGNSGGPLFRGDEVIGVNTWGRVDEGAQNLNFAVDYREVLAFIHDNL